MPLYPNATIAVRLVGSVTSAVSLVYILHGKRYRNTHEITCLHLLAIDFIWVSIGSVVVIAYPNVAARFALPFSFFTILDFFAIIPIVIDRLWAVCKPLKYGKPNHRTVMMLLLACCWILSVVYCTVVFAFKLKDFVILLITCMILPTFFDVILLGIIVVKLRKRYRLKVKKQTDQIDPIVTFAKLGLITFAFSASWIPPAVEILQAENNTPPEWGFFLNLNTITDSLLYMVPNSFIKKVILKVQKATVGNKTSASGRQ